MWPIVSVQLAEARAMPFARAASRTAVKCRCFPPQAQPTRALISSQQQNYQGVLAGRRCIMYQEDLAVCGEYSPRTALSSCVVGARTAQCGCAVRAPGAGYAARLFTHILSRHAFYAIRIFVAMKRVPGVRGERRGALCETAPLAHPSSRGASGRRIGVAPEPRRTIRPQRSAHSRAHPAFPARKNSRHNAGRHSRSTPQGQRRRAPHGTCRPACRCGGPTAAAHGAPRAQSRHAQPHVLYGSESEPRRAVSMYVGAWGSRVAGSAAPERGRSLRGVGPDVPAQHIHCHASPFAEHARPTAPQHPPQPSAGAVTADSSAAVREQEEGRATAPSRARGTHAERCALRLVSHERTRCAATE